MTTNTAHWHSHCIQTLKSVNTCSTHAHTCIHTHTPSVQCRWTAHLQEHQFTGRHHPINRALSRHEWQHEFMRLPPDQCTASMSYTVPPMPLMGAYTIFSFSFRDLLFCFSGKEQQSLGIQEHQRLMNVKVSTFGHVERKSGSKGTPLHSHIRQQ